MIELTYGGTFEESDLLAYIKISGRNYIIQGQTNCAERDHPKPSSLDYWLRQFGDNRDTKQADNSVMAALIATGIFSESASLICPDSSSSCKGLVINE